MNSTETTLDKGEDRSVDVQTMLEIGELVLNGACTFSGTNNDRIRIRQASAEAEIAVRRVVDYIGLPKNFIVFEADIDNAAAAVIGDKRVIIYDPDLLGRSDWVSLGLLAHEIGHHLSGHTLQSAGNRDDELEADQFAGYVLGKMGATAGEAREVMSLIIHESGSRTHPPKKDRVEALRDGWHNASAQTDRRSALITPPDIPDYGQEEVIVSTGIDTSMCYFDIKQGTIMQAEREPNQPYFAVTFDLDGLGRETIWVSYEYEIRKLSNATRSWFYEIAREGRRVEFETATCGSGGFVYLYRIKALPADK